MSRTSTRARILPVIILALAVIAMLRAANVWVGFTGATAQVDEAQNIAAEVAAEDPDPLRLEAEPLVETPSEVERRLLDKLAKRSQVLDKREEELDTREQLLIVAEQEIDEKIDILRAETSVLNEKIAERQEIETQEFAALSNAYERMKPRDAARIFDVLGDEILVPVAAGMRTQAISGVLAEMDPDKARALTEKLANRTAQTDGLSN